MNPRFVTKSIHAWLDYPVALSLMITPLALGLGSSHPLALWLAVGTGVAAFVLTLFTDHKLGVFRLLPYSAHLAVDLLVGVLFVFAPSILGFTGLDAWFYWINGAAVLLVVGLHQPEAAAAFKTAALSGYDPVSYFTDGRASRGFIEYTTQYEGKQYYFATAQHQQLFEQDPDKYLPQYLGYCAYGVAMGQLFDVDPRTGQVIDGKLYLNLNREILAEFNQDTQSYINQADGNWPNVAPAVAA